MQIIDAAFLLIMVFHAVVFLDRDTHPGLIGHILGRALVAGLGMLAFCAAMRALSEPLPVMGVDFWVRLGCDGFMAAFLTTVAWLPGVVPGTCGMEKDESK